MAQEKIKQVETDRFMQLEDPPEILLMVFDAIQTLLGRSTGWKQSLTSIRNDLEILSNINPDNDVSKEIHSKLKTYTSKFQPHILLESKEDFSEFISFIICIDKYLDARNMLESTPFGLHCLNDLDMARRFIREHFDQQKVQNLKQGIQNKITTNITLNKQAQDQNQCTLEYAGFTSPEQDLANLQKLKRFSIQRTVISKFTYEQDLIDKILALTLFLEQCKDIECTDKPNYQEHLLCNEEQDQSWKLKAWKKIAYELEMIDIQKIEKYLTLNPKCVRLYSDVTFPCAELLALDQTCSVVAKHTQSPSVCVRLACLTGNVSRLIKAILLLLQGGKSISQHEKFLPRLQLPECDQRIVYIDAPKLTITKVPVQEFVKPSLQQCELVDQQNKQIGLIHWCDEPVSESQLFDVVFSNLKNCLTEADENFLSFFHISPIDFLPFQKFISSDGNQNEIESFFANQSKQSHVYTVAQSSIRRYVELLKNRTKFVIQLFSDSQACKVVRDRIESQLHIVYNQNQSIQQIVCWAHQQQVFLSVAVTAPRIKFIINYNVQTNCQQIVIVPGFHCMKRTDQYMQVIHTYNNTDSICVYELPDFTKVATHEVDQASEKHYEYHGDFLEFSNSQQTMQIQTSYCSSLSCQFPQKADEVQQLDPVKLFQTGQRQPIDKDEQQPVQAQYLACVIANHQRPQSTILDFLCIANQQIYFETIYQVFSLCNTQKFTGILRYLSQNLTLNLRALQSQKGFKLTQCLNEQEIKLLYSIHKEFDPNCCELYWEYFADYEIFEHQLTQKKNLWVLKRLNYQDQSAVAKLILLAFDLRNYEFLQAVACYLFVDNTQSCVLSAVSQILNSGIKLPTQLHRDFTHLVFQNLQLLCIPTVELDHQSYQITLSELLSGGFLQNDLIDMISDQQKLDELATIAPCIKNFLQKVTDSKHDDVFRLMEQPNQVLQMLDCTYGQRQGFKAQIGSTQGYLLTRAALSVTLKLCPQLLSCYQYLLDHQDQDSQDFQMLYQSWEVCSKMRMWIHAKRQRLMLKFQAEEEVEQQLQQIIDKIFEKAEFLLKLQTPQQNSSATSMAEQVLVCLKATALASDMQSQVAYLFHKSIERIATLDLVDKSFDCNSPAEHVIDAVSRLQKLQNSSNQLSHYTDGIQAGCSIQMESKLQSLFLSILGKLAHTLARTNDPVHALTILYGMQWQFKERDFQALADSINIFNTITRGDGSSVVAQSWARLNEHKSLSKDLVLTFKDILFAVLSTVTHSKSNQLLALSNFKSTVLIQNGISQIVWTLQRFIQRCKILCSDCTNLQESVNEYGLSKFEEFFDGKLTERENTTSMFDIIQQPVDIEIKSSKKDQKITKVSLLDQFTKASVDLYVRDLLQVLLVVTNLDKDMLDGNQQVLITELMLEIIKYPVGEYAVYQASQILVNLGCQVDQLLQGAKIYLDSQQYEIVKLLVNQARKLATQSQLKKYAEQLPNLDNQLKVLVCMLHGVIFEFPVIGQEVLLKSEYMPMNDELVIVSPCSRLKSINCKINLFSKLQNTLVTACVKDLTIAKQTSDQLDVQALEDLFGTSQLLDCLILNHVTSRKGLSEKFQKILVDIAVMGQFSQIKFVHDHQAADYIRQQNWILTQDLVIAKPQNPIEQQQQIVKCVQNQIPYAQVLKQYNLKVNLDNEQSPYLINQMQLEKLLETQLDLDIQHQAVLDFKIRNHQEKFFQEIKNVKPRSKPQTLDFFYAIADINQTKIVRASTVLFYNYKLDQNVETVFKILNEVYLQLKSANYCLGRRKTGVTSTWLGLLQQLPDQAKFFFVQTTLNFISKQQTSQFRLELICKFLLHNQQVFDKYCTQVIKCLLQQTAILLFESQDFIDNLKSHVYQIIKKYLRLLAAIIDEINNVDLAKQVVQLKSIKMLTKEDAGPKSAWCVEFCLINRNFDEMCRRLKIDDIETNKRSYDQAFELIESRSLKSRLHLQSSLDSVTKVQGVLIFKPCNFERIVEASPNENFQDQFYHSVEIGQKYLKLPKGEYYVRGVKKKFVVRVYEDEGQYQQDFDTDLVDPKLYQSTRPQGYYVFDQKILYFKSKPIYSLIDVRNVVTTYQFIDDQWFYKEFVITDQSAIYEITQDFKLVLLLDGGYDDVAVSNQDCKILVLNKDLIKLITKESEIEINAVGNAVKLDDVSVQLTGIQFLSNTFVQDQDSEFLLIKSADKVYRLILYKENKVEIKLFQDQALKKYHVDFQEVYGLNHDWEVLFGQTLREFKNNKSIRTYFDFRNKQKILVQPSIDGHFDFYYKPFELESGINLQRDVVTRLDDYCEFVVLGQCSLVCLYQIPSDRLYSYQKVGTPISGQDLQFALTIIDSIYASKRNVNEHFLQRLVEQGDLIDNVQRAIYHANLLFLKNLPLYINFLADPKQDETLIKNFFNQFLIAKVRKIAYERVARSCRYYSLVRTFHFDRMTQTQNLFEQLYSQTYQRPQIYQSQFKESAFRVKFKSEGATDYGGPFRDLLEMICDEIKLKFFTQCDSTDPAHEGKLQIPSTGIILDYITIHKYKYIGNLIGYALRSYYCLPVDFSLVFWKRILSLNITLDDIELCDSVRYRQLMEIKQGSQSATFCIDFGCGTDQELIPGGSMIEVTEQNWEKFEQNYLQKYLSINQVAYDAIFCGIKEICPLQIIRLLDLSNISRIACSAPQITLEQFQHDVLWEYEHLDQEVCDLTKSLFLEFFEQMNAQQRSLLVKFITGSSKLDGINRITIVIMIMEQVSDNNDDVNLLNPQKENLQELIENPNRNKQHSIFPIAHTCGYSLDLPCYTNIEIMKQRILTAITQCGAIDADFNQDERSSNDSESYAENEGSDQYSVSGSIQSDAGEGDDSDDISHSGHDSDGFTDQSESSELSDFEKYKTYDTRYENSPVPLCSNRHCLLLVTQSRYNDVECDVCGKDIVKREGFYNCQQDCNEDLCLACYNQYLQDFKEHEQKEKNENNEQDRSSNDWIDDQEENEY